MTWKKFEFLSYNAISEDARPYQKLFFQDANFMPIDVRIKV